MQPRLDESVSDTIRRAAMIAAADGREVEFLANGVRVVVAGDTNMAALVREYDRARRGCLGKLPAIGPYPPVGLPEEKCPTN